MTETRDTVFIVDDNEDLLKTLKILLDRNGFNVISAKNGKHALEILQEVEHVPEVIISDIMMPELNGYDFFKTVSHEPRFSHVPFVFLTARSSKADVRLGKMLGADDYITKPFNARDLLAIIQGKIARNKKVSRINEALDENVTAADQESRGDADQPIFLLHVDWDDKMGPVLQDYYPSESQAPFSLQEISFQLYHAATAIYGQAFEIEQRGVLLAMMNIKRKAYVLFDAIQDMTKRTKSNLFMLAVIAPTISYFDSLNIAKVLGDLTIKIKAHEDWNIMTFHERVVNVLNLN
jgi:DNA-binding response OmpR family regulator